jgi:hypothetical protein
MQTRPPIRAGKPRRSTDMTVIRITPTGDVKSFDCTKIRDAGKHVAYVLADNCNVDRKAATQAGMQFEKAGYLESNGYTFTLAKEY